MKKRKKREREKKKKKKKESFPRQCRRRSEWVLFTFIVSCMQCHRHIRSPPSSLHSSTLSLPLIFISSVRFYCHLHSFYESFVPVLCSSHESATRQLRRAQDIFWTSKAHAATITTNTNTTVRNTNLPQFLSSEPSPQSSSPSHTKSLVMHFSFKHFQWDLEHFQSAEQQSDRLQCYV